MKSNYEKFMKIALDEAKKAFLKDEVPVGAVIVKDNKIIAKAHNLCKKKQDATAHAEIEAIKKASKKIGSYRLIDCTMFVTLEPCPMCMGAIINSRINTLVYGASDKKSGACGGKIDIATDKIFNHKTNIQKGILKEQCSTLLKTFFKSKR